MVPMLLQSAMVLKVRLQAVIVTCCSLIELQHLASMFGKWCNAVRGWAAVGCLGPWSQVCLVLLQGFLEPSKFLYLLRVISRHMPMLQELTRRWNQPRLHKVQRCPAPPPPPPRAALAVRVVGEGGLHTPCRRGMYIPAAAASSLATDPTNTLPMSTAPPAGMSFLLLDQTKNTPASSSGSGHVAQTLALLYRLQLLPDECSLLDKWILPAYRLGALLNFQVPLCIAYRRYDPCLHVPYAARCCATPQIVDQSRRSAPCGCIGLQIYMLLHTLHLHRCLTGL